MARALTTANFDLTMQFFRGEWHTFDFRSALGALRCPTLVLAGSDDPITPPSESEDIVAAMAPDLVRLEVFAGCGHPVYQDDHEKFLRVVRDFVVSLASEDGTVSYFALLYDVVDDFLTRRQPHRAEHLSAALASHARGELVLAGAFAEPVDGALLVFRCADRSVPESFARSDPYVRAGLVKRWIVRPWSVVIGEPSSDPSSAVDRADDPLAAFLERFVTGLSGPWLDKARQFRPASDVPIGELGAHPDLGERLRDVTADLRGTEFGVHYRMFAARKVGGADLRSRAGNWARALARRP